MRAGSRAPGSHPGGRWRWRRPWPRGLPAGAARSPKMEGSAGRRPAPTRGVLAVPPPMLTFQQLILKLQSYWDAQGCALLQPYDMEVGAGTSHTATFLRAIGPEPWKAAYV